MTLSADHRALLLAAGISESLAAAHARTITDTRQLNGVGFYPVPGIEFCWERLEGGRFRQYRPDRPGGGGKYVQAPGSGTTIMVPDGHLDLLRDPSVPLLICEGTKQHLAVASVDVGRPLAVAGIVGCWGWRSAGGPNEAFRNLPVADRDIYVLYDADVLTNANVYCAGQALVGYLLDCGAGSVRWVGNPGEGKEGIDDLLTRQDDPSGFLVGLLARSEEGMPAIDQTSDEGKALAREVERLAKHGGHRDLSLRIQAATLNHHALVRAADDGLVYAIRRGERVATPFGRDTCMSVIARTPGIGSTGAAIKACSLAADFLQSQVTKVSELHLRMHMPDDDTVVIDLGIPSSARCVVVTAKGWTRRPRQLRTCRTRRHPASPTAHSR